MLFFLQVSLKTHVFNIRWWFFFSTIEIEAENAALTIIITEWTLPAKLIAPVNVRGRVIPLLWTTTITSKTRQNLPHTYPPHMCQTLKGKSCLSVDWSIVY